ncbi:MAG: ThiF family adenylyltransferase [Lachnospiraceae bacterium]
MQNQFERTELLFGREAMEVLRHAHVAVFGIGGVGGYVTEALARSGIGSFELVDSDTVCLSNLNRQIIATQETIGRYKTEVMKERILSINPEAKVTVRNCFFLPKNEREFDFSTYSYVVDAVDTVTAKLSIVMAAKAAGVPVISSMGAGNKINPAEFEVADIYETSVCPLAKVMRRELKKRGIESLKVVYSKETPLVPLTAAATEDEPSETVPECSELSEKQPVRPGKRVTPGSNAFVPSVAGLIIASEVVKDLTGIRNH